MKLHNIKGCPKYWECSLHDEKHPGCWQCQKRDEFNNFFAAILKLSIDMDIISIRKLLINEIESGHKQKLSRIMIVDNMVDKLREKMDEWLEVI